GRTGGSPTRAADAAWTRGTTWARPSRTRSRAPERGTADGPTAGRAAGAADGGRLHGRRGRRGPAGRALGRRRARHHRGRQRARRHRQERHPPAAHRRLEQRAAAVRFGVPGAAGGAAGSADEQRSQLLGALQSGSAAYDVVNLDVTWVPEFAAAGLVRPLPGNLVDEDVVPSVAGTARWDGEVYAVPFNSDVGLLYYRRDYLERAGVRRADLESWAGVRDLVETLDSRLDEDAYDKGWTTQLAAYEGRTVNAVEAFASAVEDFSLVDEEGRYAGTVEDLADGIAELGRRTGRPYTLADAVHSDEAASLSDFAAGRTAFLRHWPYVYPALHRTFTKEQLGVVPLPGRAVLGGQNLAVTSSSPRARSATDL